MFKGFRQKVGWATLLLVCPLILAIVSNGYGNGEPPPVPPGLDERERGPATVGTLTFGVVDATHLEVTFVGRCSQQDVLFGPSVLPGTIAGITAEKLINRRQANGVNLTSELQSCYSAAGVFSGDLIVNTVTKIIKTGTTASADVVLLAVVVAP